MRRKVWLTAPMCLLVVSAMAALVASNALGGVKTKKVNPTLNVAVDSTDVDHSDPGLAYSVLGWQIEYETCVPLVGYADTSHAVDTSVSPIGAKALPVIKDNGKTYVFTIRSGFKFSDGTALTAANYQDAINRDASKTLNSPATAFEDSQIVGWDKVYSGSATSVSGVTVSGNKLTIKLTKANGSILPQLAMPFFCPIEKAAPFYSGGKWNDTEITGSYPAPGPYYLSQRDVGTDIILKKNTHYSGSRPRKAGTIVINMLLSQPTAYNGIQNGTYAADLNGNPNPAQNFSLEKQYGKNKGRFWVHPELETTYLAMNTSRKAFKLPGTRQGINYVTNRPAVIKVGGYESGSATSQVLPQPLTGGVYKANLYPIKAPGNKQFAKGKSLSKDCAGGKKINFWHGNSTTADQTAAILSFDFKKMGCKVNSVPVAGYARYVQGGVKGNSMDIMTAGWVDDYPDGYDFLHILLDGRTIGPNNNNDLAYFNNRKYNAMVDHANSLSGTARSKAWGTLDQWVMKNFAPWAPIENANVVDFLSANAHGYVFDGPFGSIDLGAFYQS